MTRFPPYAPILKRYQADIASIKQYLEMFTQHLVQSGVGGLPLLLEGAASLPKDEAALFADASASVKELYARKQQLEENNGIVASLLAVPERQAGGEIKR